MLTNYGNVASVVVTAHTSNPTALTGLGLTVPTVSNSSENFFLLTVDRMDASGNLVSQEPFEFVVSTQAPSYPSLPIPPMPGTVAPLPGNAPSQGSVARSVSKVPCQSPHREGPQVSPVENRPKTPKSGFSRSGGGLGETPADQI